MKDVESVLKSMIEMGQVVQLPKEAGKREARYAHLFSGEVTIHTQEALGSVDN